MDQEQPWALGSTVDDGQFHSLAHVRDLSPVETVEIDEALRLLWWVTRGSQWNGVLAAWEDLLSVEPRGVSDIATMNQSVFRLLRALTRFSTQLETTPPELESIALALRQQDPFQWLSRSGAMSARAPAEPPRLIDVRSHEPRPGRRLKTVHLSQAAADWLGDLASLDAPAVTALEDVVSRAQRNHAAMLLAFEGAIVSASLVVKRYAAEVALGRPILLRLSRVDGKNQTYDIRDFALEDLPRLSIAIARAKRLEDQSEGNLGDHVGASPNPVDVAPAGEDPSQKPRSQSDADDAASPNWTAMDPVGLFLRTRGLADEMEIRWSNALADVLNEESIDAALAQWHSLLISESGALSGRDADVQTSWPPTVDSLVDESPRGRESSDALGYIAALVHLTRTLDALAVPTNRALTLTGRTATLRQWWSSGGFSLVRSSAQMLLRVAQEIGNGQPLKLERREGVGIPDRLQTSWPEVWLESAQRAMDAGLPEATLIYCLYAYESWSDRPAILHPARRQAALSEFERLVPRTRNLVAAGAKGPQPSVELLPLALVALDALSVAMTTGQIVVNLESEGES